MRRPLCDTGATISGFIPQRSCERSFVSAATQKKSLLTRFIFSANEKIISVQRLISARYARQPLFIAETRRSQSFAESSSVDSFIHDHDQNIIGKQQQKFVVLF